MIALKKMPAGGIVKIFDTPSWFSADWVYSFIGEAMITVISYSYPEKFCLLAWFKCAWIFRKS